MLFSELFTNLERLGSKNYLAFFVRWIISTKTFRKDSVYHFSYPRAKYLSPCERLRTHSGDDREIVRLPAIDRSMRSRHIKVFANLPSNFTANLSLYKSDPNIILFSSLWNQGQGLMCIYFKMQIQFCTWWFYVGVVNKALNAALNSRITRS